MNNYVNYYTCASVFRVVLETTLSEVQLIQTALTLKEISKNHSGGDHNTVISGLYKNNLLTAITTGI